MRELSVEEKAKAYDEAIEKLRDFYRDYDTVSCLIDVKEELANLFPELKESEDEKIRKVLKHYLEVRRCQTQSDEEYINCNNFLAWLEKQGTSYTKKDVDDAYVEGMAFAKNELERQGEQKSQRMISAEAKEAMYDKPTDEDMKEALRTEYEKGRADAFAQMQQGWSDKEKQMYADIIEATKKSGVFKEAYKRELVDFLNFLKERHTWKPSDEQIRALEYIINNAHNTSYSCKIAKGLLEQLKKLKGE